MSAVPVIDGLKKSVNGIFQPAFDTWTSEEILAYFQSRSEVKYFTIADKDQVTREKIDAILTNQFDFNGEIYHFENEVDWLTNPSPDIEWAIMLHKFYYSVGLGMAYEQTGDECYVNKWMELTRQWIDSVPLDLLSADVTGRRVQNWIFAHYYFVTVCPSKSITPDFYQLFLNSLHQQVSYLCENLTPARNHRTLELYTIFLAAVVFPELKNADSWLTFSTDELVKNIKNDILPDGVHCELSTDYHHIVLRNFLAVKRLALLNDIALPNEMDLSIKKALDFCAYIHKPDGFIPSLSDGDVASFLDLLTQGYEFYREETWRYVATFGKLGIPPGQRCKAFEQGGYYVIRSGWGESGETYSDQRYLVFDCGPIGAGNHGHLDLLSFEMAAYGKSLIVDPGRYTYDESGETNWRVLFRGTSYHNTVTVDGLNQTRYEFHKQKFKITGQHPEFELKSFVSQPGFDFLHGVAVSQEYPVKHERKIIFVNGEYWVILDELTAQENHQYDVNFHLSDIAEGNVNLNKSENCTIVSSPHLLIAQPLYNATQILVKPGFISQTYGIKHAAPIVKFSREDSTCSFCTVLYPFKDNAPKLSIACLPTPKVSHSSDSPIGHNIDIKIETNHGAYLDRIFIASQSSENPARKEQLTEAVTLERISDRTSFSVR